MNDKNNINKKQDNNDSNSRVGYGVAFGLLGGAAFSTIGPGFGMLIGIVIGSIMDLNKNKK